MTRYTFKVNRKGRKWMEVEVSGKYSSCYNAQLLIDETTKNFAIGETYTIPCRFENKSNNYGKKYFLYAVSAEEFEAKQEEQKTAQGSKLMGYIRKAAREGYIHRKGIEEIKALGSRVMEVHNDEINEIIRTINAVKAAGEADREEKRKAEKAEREALCKAEEAKYSYLVLPAYYGYKGQPQPGQIIEKGRIYKVISSYYNKEDGWSFGAMNEEWYSVKCVDITDTQEGQERLARKAASDAERKAKLEAAQAEKSKIDSLKKAIRENGERVVRTEDGRMQYWPEGKTLYDDMNIYGGGEAIVKTDSYFWLIINNGTDGGDWSINTIRTGGAGAYGWKIDVEKIEE